MSTELKKFAEAYATMTVAVYEPIILEWFSGMGMWMLADMIAQRNLPSDEKRVTRRSITGEMQLRTHRLPKNPIEFFDKQGIQFDKLTFGSEGFVNAEMLSNIGVKGLNQFPNLEITPDALFFNGRMEVTDNWDNNAKRERQSGLPVFISSNAHSNRSNNFNFELLEQKFLEVSKIVYDSLKESEKLEVAEMPDHLKPIELQIKEMNEALLKRLQELFKDGSHYLPTIGSYHEALSPIGVAHFYRQLYFYLDEGVGPIEQAFTIAPGETLELVYETVRRQIHEEITEMGSEVVSETALESKNMDEVSDKVASMIQRDSSAAMSSSATINASGGIGVWQASASANVGISTSLAQSNQRSNEIASQRLTSTTKQASERITKTFSLRVRDVDDLTTTNLTRRVIKNDQGSPISYGLRRVFNRIMVKVQDLGPQLVWQLYLRNPGTGLARSQFVHFLDSKPISSPVDPPAIRQRPTGGTDTGTTSAAVNYDKTYGYYVTLVVRTGSDRKVTAVSIDSITDLEGGGKDDLAPSAINDVQWDRKFDESTNTFEVKIGILPGDAASISINYSYVYEPGEAIIQAWEEEKKKAEEEFRNAEAAARESALREQFERDKALITEKSRIRPRPANDLRREERFEVMNRMISHLFARGENPQTPSPLEIEYFHRYFDIEAMFVYTHPSWWVPRYSPIKTGFGRPLYEITAESEPAPMGSSLGWVMQLDGDTRRNEFINSPWVRVCLPIHPNRENEAISWLAKHIEGEIGYTPDKGLLKGLLEDIKKIRGDQDALGINGPEYVTISSTVGAPSGPAKPENVFPVIDEFEVTIPTEGFIYDDLKVIIP